MVYEFTESYKNIAIVLAAQNRMQEALKMSDKSMKIVESHTELKRSRTYFFCFIHACNSF